MREKCLNTIKLDAAGNISEVTSNNTHLYIIYLLMTNGHMTIAN